MKKITKVSILQEPKRAFQLKLKAFFIFFEGFYVGEIEKLAGSSLDKI